MNNKLTLFFSCLIFLLSKNFSASAEMTPRSNTRNSDRGGIAVLILSEKIISRNQTGTIEVLPEYIPIASGSLLRISKDATNTTQYIVTNAHVIRAIVRGKKGDITESTVQIQLLPSDPSIPFSKEEIVSEIFTLPQYINNQIDPSMPDAELIPINSSEKLNQYGSSFKSFSIQKSEKIVYLSAFRPQKGDSRGSEYVSISMNLKFISSEKIQYEPISEKPVERMSGGAILDSSNSIIGIHVGDSTINTSSPIEFEGLPSVSICALFKQLKEYCSNIQKSNAINSDSDILISPEFGTLDKWNSLKDLSTRPPITGLW